MSRVRQNFHENLQHLKELAGKGDLSHLQKIAYKNVNNVYHNKSTNKEKHVAVAKAAQAASLKMVGGTTKDSPKLWLKKALKQAIKKRAWNKRSS